MPPSAYALIATFAGASLLAGTVAARLIGPWRWWAPILPALAAFGLLYLVAHRWALSPGPEVSLWGWKVALPFDLAVAVAAAAGVGLLQRGASSLLQPEQ